MKLLLRGKDIDTEVVIGRIPVKRMHFLAKVENSLHIDQATPDLWW